MKVVVVGSGSIARRYIEILRTIRKIEILVVSDFSPEGSFQHPVISRENFAQQVNSSIGIYDLLIIASVNSLHISDFEKFSPVAKKVLMEKPLFYRSLSTKEYEIFEKYPGELRVSSPLRFHQCFVQLTKKMDLVGKINFIEVRCQSWLPNWRPGRDFKSGFWNDTTEGGVLREIIHELDYLLKLFGPLEVLWATTTESNFLRLNVESGVSAILRTISNRVIDVRLDYCSRSPRRYIRIEGDSGTLHWDVLQGVLHLTDETGLFLDEYAEDKNRNTTFKRQIDALMNPESWDISGTSLLEASQSVELIEKMYEASRR